MTVSGFATLASNSFKLDDNQKKEYSHEEEEFFTVDYGVSLDKIEMFEQPKSMKDLVPKLNFIENKIHWGAYFQGGVRQITEEDYYAIIGESKARAVSIDHEDTRTGIDSIEFALESHLEGFIYRNWDSIDWNANLELYKTEDQDGRQFPAGTWSIDLLAHDKNTKDLVVIELKRGKTSDSTVGQVLRYVAWVKENIAEPDQNVRGIIIAKDIDNPLKYAVKNLDFIDIKTYVVDFKLFSFEN